MSGHKEGRDLRLPREPEDRGSSRSRRMSVKSYLPLPRATLLSPSKVSPRIPPLVGDWQHGAMIKAALLKQTPRRGHTFRLRLDRIPLGCLSRGPSSALVLCRPLRVECPCAASSASETTPSHFATSPDSRPSVHE